MTSLCTTWYRNRQCCGTVIFNCGSGSFEKVLVPVPEQDQDHRHFGVKFPACQKTGPRHTNVTGERKEAGLQTNDKNYRQTEFSLGVVPSSVWFGKKANQMTTFIIEARKFTK
jgi:hypothetical protein